MSILFRSLMSLITLGGTIVLSACPTSTRKNATRGEAMFVGREPLKGTIRGHQGVLPPEVVICGNCHPGRDRMGADAAAPRIDRSWLLSARRRRLGPPSSYDSAAFCRLLRTGVDPAYVLVAREMPVYDIDDTQCLDLWRFFTLEAVNEGEANGNR